MKNFFKKLKQSVDKAVEQDKSEPLVVDEDQGGCDCTACVLGDTEPSPTIEVIQEDDEII